MSTTKRTKSCEGSRKNFNIRELTKLILRDDSWNIIHQKKAQIIDANYLKDGKLREMLTELAQDDDDCPGNKNCQELLTW